MIVAQQKDFDEIKEMIRGYKRLLVLGCQTCVAISFAGGKHEVEIMASMIRIDRKMTEQDVEIREDTIVRQCDFEFMDPIKDQVADADAVLSLACGVGVQTMAERFPDKVILPGLNTGFMGMTEKLGVWSERCAGCGNCILDKTGGLCPVARCSKSLFNGPCGGSVDGKCEINPDIDCVWQLIIDRLKKLNRLESLEDILPVKDWGVSGHGGPRKVVREDLIT
jgi:hypothetical protein